MSGKVSRRIRQQRRAARKTLTRQRRIGRGHSAAEAAGGHRSTANRRPGPTGAGPTGGAARLIAVLAGVALILGAGGSAAAQLLGAESDQPRQLPLSYVAAPPVAERLVCPPTPGAPDSFNEPGILDYAERDDSAESVRSALLFASAYGAIPSAQWAPITDQGREEPDLIQDDAGPTDELRRPLLADRQPTIAQLEAATHTPAVLEVQPLEGTAVDDAPAAAASFTYHADEGPQAGLITSPCTTPVPSQWFLGPETGSGAASLLTLTNPHSRDARVSVSTYSPEGSTGSLGATTLLVPADSVRTLNLAALTDGAAHLAVHVQATGAPVAGHLQSSHASGSSGLGTDLLPAMTEAQTEHRMPAVPAGAGEAPQLWLYVPGESGAEVELQVFDDEGQVLTDTPGVFTVEAAEVSVIEVEGLEPGTYTVAVGTEQPSFAGVRSAGPGPGAETAPDLSWASAASRAQPGFGALLSQVGDSDLHLFGEGELTYRLLDSAGESTADTTIELEAGIPAVVSHQDLQDQAEQHGLEDAYSLVITEVTGETHGATITRHDDGRFSIGALGPISPTAQYVPLRFQR